MSVVCFHEHALSSHFQTYTSVIPQHKVLSMLNFTRLPFFSDKVSVLRQFGKSSEWESLDFIFCSEQLGVTEKVCRLQH